MNEDRLKLKIGKKGERKRQGTWQSFWVKPTGKFWKRLFNKKVRKGEEHKKGNWWHWS